jgi:hypothetical protein
MVLRVQQGAHHTSLPWIRPTASAAAVFGDVLCIGVCSHAVCPLQASRSSGEHDDTARACAVRERVACR